MSKYCPNCGMQIPDSAVFCTECGTRFPDSLRTDESAHSVPAQAVSDTYAVSAASFVKPKKKRTGVFIVLACLLVLFSIAAVFFFTGKIDRLAASSKADSDDFAGALESYEKYLSRSKDTSAEAYMQASLYALNSGDADKALMYLKEIPEKSAESDRLSGMAEILLAKQSMDDKKWENALVILDRINSDEAKTLADECRFHLAENAAENRDYDGAIAYLKENPYAGASDLLEECIYNKASDYINAGMIKEALDFLEDHPSDKTKVLLEECRYQYASSLMDNGEWLEAIAFLEENSSPESDELLEECRYRYAVTLMAEEKWEEAIAQFEQTSYADSAALSAECAFAASADSHFLADLIVFCNDLRSSDFSSSSVSKLVKTIEPYSSQVFLDPSLQKYARAFISDMQSIRNLLSSSSSSSSRQAQCCDVLADASDQLNGINKLYPFESTVWKNISSYFKTSSYWKDYAAVVRQIASDMASKSASGYYSAKQQFIRVPNNTKHDVVITFWFYCYDSKGNLISTDEVHAELPKGKKTQVVFECNASKSPKWGYDFYIDNIS